MTIALAASQPRQRQRPQQTQNGAQNNAASGINTGGWMKRGTVAKAVLEEEQQRAEDRREQRQRERNIPFNFKMRAGEQVDIVILDAQPGPSFFEHNMKDRDTGYFTVFEACPKEFDQCPLCERDGPSYYVMLLTVIEMKPYTNERTGETTNHRRKLMRVKQAQQPLFHRLFERHGTLRGMHLLMTRDNDKTAAIGAPEFIALYDENTILQSFQHPEVKGQKGDLIKPANADCYPVEYEDLFPRPSGQDLRTRYGGAAPVGAHGGGNDDGWGGYDPNNGGGAARPSRGGGITPAASGGGIQRAAGGGNGQANGHAHGHDHAGHDHSHDHGGQSSQGADQDTGFDAAQGATGTQGATGIQRAAPQGGGQGGGGGGIQPRSATAGQAATDYDDDIPF